MKKTLFILSVLLLGTIVQLKADEVRIHALVFCDTGNSEIGVSCNADKERFISELSIVESALNCEVDWLNVYTGNFCDKPNLEEAISKLRCEPNDVIFFYYSGHGAHAQADNGWLPQMCLKYESYDQENFVPVEWVVEKLSRKGARLTVVLTDCCNDNKDWVTAKGLVDSEGENVKIDCINVENLRKLFYKSKGSVVATSSKRGQRSWGSDKGGTFSISFWDEMYRIEQGQGGADWKSLMEKTKVRTLEASRNNQEPVCEIKIVGLDDNNNNDKEDDIVNVVSVDEKELGSAIKKLLDKSVSRYNRLYSEIPNICNKFFTEESKVLLVGRNRTTKLDYLLVEDYMKRLALSKTIKGINIVRIKKNESGKLTEVIINEIIK